MQNTSPSPSLSAKLYSFWQRQFTLDTTEAQARFDILFGVIFVIVWGIALPIVTYGEVRKPLLLGYLHLLIYISGGAALMAQLLSSLVSIRFWWRPYWLISVLWLDILAALTVGVALLPLSVSLMPWLVGIIGFTPFFTAFTWFRISWRLLHGTNQVARTTHRLAFSFGVFLVWFMFVGSVQVSGWFSRPDIESLPIYPQASSFQISPWHITDSGTASETVQHFETSDSASDVVRFYQEQLLTSGWVAVDNPPYEVTLSTGEQQMTASYDYASASGRHYRAYLLIYDHREKPYTVVVNLKRY